MNSFDLIVIGGGPAGYFAAELASKSGLSVCVFEMNALGGVCLNEGCIPSKALLNSAKIYSSALHGEVYGVKAEKISLDHATALKRKDKVVKLLTAGVAAKMRKNGVVVIKEKAGIIKREDGLFFVKAGDETYTSEKLLVATGSSPVLPPINGLAQALESGFCLTNKEILSLPGIPESLAVIGAGVIGLEMASYYAAAGSRVTVIEATDKIAGATDEEISSVLRKSLEKNGIGFILGATVTGISEGRIEFVLGDEERVLYAEKLLICTGRRPNTSGIGLEDIGVKLDKGAVVTDERLRTNIPGLYAAGDINGKSMLAHTAYREAQVAVNDMLGIDDSVDYSAIPSVIYTYPEAACVGETLASAGEKGIRAREITLPLTMSGRYVAEVDRGTGFAKAVIDENSKVLGIHILGSYASEIIGMCAEMLSANVSIEEMKKVVIPHPSVSEIIRELMFEAERS